MTNYALALTLALLAAIGAAAWFDPQMLRRLAAAMLARAFYVELLRSERARIREMSIEYERRRLVEFGVEAVES